MTERNSKGNEKKKITISIVLILLLIISVVGMTYAIFIFAKEGKNENIISTGSVTFSYTETSNGILLNNALPMSDDVGKKLENQNGNIGYFDFSVSCKVMGTSSINYEVYAQKESVSREINEDYVKIYLTDRTTDLPVSGYNAQVPTYSKLPTATSNSSAKRLYYSKFNNTGVQSYRLRMWLSDDYEIKSSSEQFKIKVNVTASN